MRFTSPLPTAICLNGILLLAGSAYVRAQQPGITATSAESALPSSTESALPSAPMAAGNISGTATDAYGDVVPGATVVLESADQTDRQSSAANDNGFFTFGGIKPETSYHVTIRAKGFEDWVSPAIVVASGQFFDVTGVKLKLSNAVESVTVTSSTEQIATQQVLVEEQQRVLGFIPNFYVVYDAKNAVPMTTKLKFRLAMKVSIDPVSIAGAAFMAGIKQAADTPDYQQGWKGYGQRFGAQYADAVTDIMFGGAILPSLLHQDPRYFYQGTGTTKSRILHAISNPFIARGDNGKLQPNFSSIGGDLISSAISNAYYPASNRGVGFTFNNLLIDTAERTATSLVQEFVLRRFTPSAR